eukprot:ANDGO_06706.mRNA.1 hypothetical protein ACA1_182660
MEISADDLRNFYSSRGRTDSCVESTTVEDESVAAGQTKTNRGVHRNARIQKANDEIDNLFSESLSKDGAASNKAVDADAKNRDRTRVRIVAFTKKQECRVGQSPAAVKKASMSRKRDAAFLASSVNEVLEKPKETYESQFPFLQVKRSKKLPMKEEDHKPDEEFLKDARLVSQFGAQFLNKRQRKAYEESHIKSLGGDSETREKMPLKVLQGMRQKHQERMQKKQHAAKNQGMVLWNSYVPQIMIPTHDKEKKEKRFRGLKETVGKFKDGVLHVPQHLVSSGGGKK